MEASLQTRQGEAISTHNKRRLLYSVCNDDKKQNKNQYYINKTKTLQLWDVDLNQALQKRVANTR